MKGLNTWLLMLSSCRSPVKIEQNTMGKTVPACYLPPILYCNKKKKITLLFKYSIIQEASKIIPKTKRRNKKGDDTKSLL